MLDIPRGRAPETPVRWSQCIENGDWLPAPKEFIAPSQACMTHMMRLSRMVEHIQRQYQSNNQNQHHKQSMTLQCTGFCVADVLANNLKVEPGWRLRMVNVTDT